MSLPKPLQEIIQAPLKLLMPEPPKINIPEPAPAPPPAPPPPAPPPPPAAPQQGAPAFVPNAPAQQQTLQRASPSGRRGRSSLTIPLALPRGPGLQIPR